MLSAEPLDEAPTGIDAGRARRLQEVVCAVAAQTLHDWGATRVALLHDGTPEAELALRWLGEGLGHGAVIPVDVRDQTVESLLQLSGTSADAPLAEAELRRMRARLVPDAIVASPASKTALLLSGPLPPEPLLPLADLYASEIAHLVGDCSVPQPLRQLVDLCGGVERLDAALRRYLDERDPRGLSSLGRDGEREVLAALDRGRGSRLWPRIVPKIGRRTLCIDLFE